VRLALMPVVGLGYVLVKSSPETSLLAELFLVGLMNFLIPP